MAGRTNNSLSAGTSRIGVGIVAGLVLAIAAIIAVGDTALAGAVVSLGVAVGAGLAIGAVAGEVVNRHKKGKRSHVCITEKRGSHRGAIRRGEYVGTTRL